MCGYRHRKIGIMTFVYYKRKQKKVDTFPLRGCRGNGWPNAIPVDQLIWIRYSKSTDSVLWRWIRSRSFVSVRPRGRYIKDLLTAQSPGRSTLTLQHGHLKVNVFTYVIQGSLLSGRLNERQRLLPVTSHSRLHDFLSPCLPRFSSYVLLNPDCFDGP